ncbi:sulfatase-like hydrolase/transferase [Hyphococcus sp.]|uniref:sulfatase-like hydrolase/transferase n=1 Tax=Hyphococcus sp. TaxID=2038636 RepID=UPI0035C705D8
MTTTANENFLKLSPEGVALVSAAAFLSLTVLLYIPAQIYFANLEAFQAGFMTIAGRSLAICAGAMGGAYLAARALPQQPLRIAAAVFAVLAVLGFVFGAVLTPMTIDLGLVDGGDAKLSIPPLYLALDIMLIAGLFALFYFQFANLRSFLINMFVMGAVFMLGYAAYAAITAGGQEKSSEAETTNFPVEDFFKLSQDENIILILLDSFDSHFFDLLLLEDGSLTQALDGFTFFRDAASVSPTTTGAMPAIHSGQMIYYDRPLSDSFKDLVVEGSFLSTMTPEADVMLLNPKREVCAAKIICGHTADLAAGGNSSASKQWGVLVSISMFRSAPYLLKPALYDAPEWFVALSAAGNDAGVLDAMAASLSPTAARPQVRFLHFLHTHTPYNREFDCTEIPPQNSNPRIAMNNMRCAMKGVANYIDALKAANLYDQSTILIFADHGAVAFDANLVSTLDAGKLRITPDGRFMAPRAETPDAGGAGHNAPRSSHPLFLVKPKGARGPLQLNAENAVSLLDIPATTCEDTELCASAQGYNAFEAPPANDRVRPYYDYDMRPFQSAFGTDKPASESVTALSVTASQAATPADVKHDLVRAFSFSREGAIPGFGFPERWGRWNAEEQANFDLCFEAPPTGEEELVLNGRVYLPEKSARQQVRASFNGRTVLDQTYAHKNPADRETQTWRLPLQPSDLDDNNCVTVAFETPDAPPAPASWREAERRRIGVGLVSMQLEGGAQ